MKKVDHDGRIMLLLKIIKMMKTRTEMQTMKIMMMKIMIW